MGETSKYMSYEIKKFENLVGFTAFSTTSIQNHLTLYEGYVKNVNTIMDLFKTLKAGTPEYNELRRRLAWEWNGMRMHEFYFGSMTNEVEGLRGDSILAQAINSAFGSYEAWLADFKSVGMTRGIGWAVLIKDKISGNLMNIWVGEHDLGHFSGEEILLAMDVWEHSYITDFGIKRADYIEKFIPHIDWPVVESRFE
jgi:superoxide dismutase, Fe-Mn family